MIVSDRPSAATGAAIGEKISRAAAPIMLPKHCWEWMRPRYPESRKGRRMKLGAFSISLAVKDLAASRAFYEGLGFNQVGGNPAQNWLILRNDNTTIGLFQGMFERNMLTFNPGWTP